MTTTTTDDPFEALQKAAENQVMLEQADRLLREARCHLVLGKPAPQGKGVTVGSSTVNETKVACAFFASLALPLKLLPCPGMGTASTDGRTLRYDPEFVRSLSPPALVGLWAHEVLHITNGHHWRMGARDPQRGNIAADLAINPLLRDAGFTLPAGALFPGAGAYLELPSGLSFEEYYPLLPDPKGKDRSKDDPGNCGGVDQPGASGGEAGTESARAEAQAEAAIATQQAAKVAQDMASRLGKGSLPGWLDRLVREVLEPRVDWREALHDFLSQRARGGRDWGRPARRYLPFDIYMPCKRTTTLGEIVVAVDTSGSIGEEMLALFGGEIQAILELFACHLTVVYHDSKVTHTQRWEPGDGPLVLEARGGGGTSHVPVFAWLEEHPELEASCLVALTDLYTDFPENEPALPVLWAVTGNRKPSAPWGQIVKIEEASR